MRIIGDSASGAPLNRVTMIVSLSVLLCMSTDLVSTFSLGVHNRDHVGGLDGHNAAPTLEKASDEAPINLTTDTHPGNVTHEHTPNITLHLGGEVKKEEGKTLPSWNYALHGADWTAGMCRIGRMQSPVDLHVDGLVTRAQDNIKDIFEAVLKGNSVPHSIKNGWKRGDMVYTYRHLISAVQVLRTDQVFRLSVPTTEGSSFGALFTTDKPNLYMATHLEFHSPSEHTFDGSANRRQVEVQIWHYYGDDADSGISGIEKNERTDLNVLVNSDDLFTPGEDDAEKGKHQDHDANKQPPHDKPKDEVKVEKHAEAKEEPVKHGEAHPPANETVHQADATKAANHVEGTLAVKHVDTNVHHGNGKHERHERNQQNGHVSHHAAQNEAHHDHGEIATEKHAEDDHEHEDEEDVIEEEEVAEEDENDNGEVSFIEVFGDAEFKDGHHVVSPAGLAKGAEKAEVKHEEKTGGKEVKNETNKEGEKNVEAPKHPLQTEKSLQYDDMLEHEQFDLLNKYLLEHLHNATYDKEGETVHVRDKTKARRENAHWGRWAVLSMTFMSEEMEKTKIETLKSFPSERFMEQVVKAGSQVEVKGDNTSPTVGELGTAGGTELPIVELDSPINLSSVLMMLETKDLNYFAYDGSFTHPGCEETVRWYVAKESLPISTELMLRINRMLNQTHDSSAVSEPINKYRELQNVNNNLHNAGKVHLVHGYPMEYFIATSFDKVETTTRSGGLSMGFPKFAIYAIIALCVVL